MYPPFLRDRGKKKKRGILHVIWKYTEKQYEWKEYTITHSSHCELDGAYIVGTLILIIMVDREIIN